MASMTTDQTAPSSSSSSSSSVPRRKHDVFLSFYGGDTRRSFTDHLYVALEQKGIVTFRDDEKLERGTYIAPELMKAVEESKYAITVLSRNYAFSRWCLTELAKIVECMKETGLTVLPVFYHVDPSHVRNQTGTFAEAFAKHEKDPELIQDVQMWRAAFKNVGNLSGWHVQERHESTIIREIIEKILGELNSKFSYISKDLVGIDSYVEKVMNLFDIRLDDVRFIGICGMAGVGKTTLAKVIFDRESCRFDASSFIDCVREESGKNGLVSIQKQLLSKILHEKDITLWNVHEGTDVIRKRLCNRKVLIVLDDVDGEKQLKALAGSHDWFGPGSRIIVTSRDRHLLKRNGVDDIYTAEVLEKDEALQLFSWKAFKKPHPEEKYMDVSKDFVDYAKGLPLALEVLGSSLFDRSIDAWKSARDKLTANPNREILDILRIGFDGLEDTEKNLFLDISCFFKGEVKDRIIDILESFGYCPHINIEILMDKSLITMLGRKLWMHDLLQEMGQVIVSCESPELGRRSRLWLSEDVLHVLKKNTGTQYVQGIAVNLPIHNEEHLNAEAFSTMTEMRLLKISNLNLLGGLNYLSSELRVMEWHGYPLKSMPASFQSDKLIELRMHCSHIKLLWKGIKSFGKLKLIDLSDSQNLIETPDFTRVPNLERLILQGCISLSKLHPSVGVLKQLIQLNLQGCKCLYSLPSNISLESLEIFNLSGCSRLQKFPEIVGNMTCLSKLYLDGTAIKELPLSFKNLSGLILLSLRDCKNLSILPSVICSLSSLKTLTLSGCSRLVKMPENLQSMECLEELDASETAVRQVPSSILILKNLKKLSFHGCKGLPPKSWDSLFFCCLFLKENSDPISLLLPTSFVGLSSLVSLDLSDCNLLDGAIPDDLSCLSSLQSLNLSGNKFTSLPNSICQLSKLIELSLVNCSRLQALPKLPLSILYVWAQNCTSLETYSNQIYMWTSSENVAIVNCSRLAENEDQKYDKIFASNAQSHLLFQNLEAEIYHSKVISGSSWETGIPEWFNNKSTSSSISIQLHPDLDDHSLWLGYALFIIYEFHDDDNSNFGIFERSNLTLDSKDLHQFIYHFETDEGRLKRPLALDTPKIPSVGPIGFWVYIPHTWFLEGSNNLDRWTYIEASITTCSPGVKVKKCGARLLYQRDALGFVKAISRCSLGGLCEDRSSYPQLAEFMSTLPSCDGEPERVSTSVPSPIPIEEQLKRDIDKLLLRCYEVNHAQNKMYKYIFPIHASPSWFMEHTFGHSTEILLPPNLYDDKEWIGFALYACFAVQENPTVSCNSKFSRNFIICLLSTDDGCVQSFIIFPLARDKFVEPYRLLLFHIPRVFFTRKLNRHNSIRAMIGSYGSSGMEAEVCGMRIVYQRQLEEFVQIIIDCILHSPVVYHQGYHQSLVNQVNSLPSSTVHQAESSGLSEGYSSSSQRRLKSLQKVTSNIEHLPQQDDDSIEKYLGGRGTSRDSNSNITQIFNNYFLRSEIPEGFCCHSGPSVAFKLCPSLYDNPDWAGIALCAVFTFLKHPTIIDDSLGSEISHGFTCYFGSDVGRTIQIDKNITESEFKKSSLNQRDFIWLLYIPRVLIVDGLKKCNIAKALFESESQDLMVHKCGHGLISKRNEDQVVQMIIQCSSTFSKNSQPIHQFEANDSRNNKQSCDDEGATSLTSSSNERLREPIYLGKSSATGNKLYISEEHITKCMNFLKKQFEDFIPLYKYDRCLPPSEISDLFSHLSAGPSVTIELPSNLYNDVNWMGFVVCASFSVQEYPTEFLDNLESCVPHHLICLFETDIGSLKPLHVYCTTKDEFKWLHLRGFNWLFFIPFWWHSDRMNQCKRIEASIVSDWPGWMVQKCALRLVHQQDLQELWEILFYCSASFLDNWDLFREDVVEQDCTPMEPFSHQTEEFIPEGSDSSSHAYPTSTGSRGSVTVTTIQHTRALKSFILRCYEGLEFSAQMFDQDEIPQWFSHLSMGPSIRIPIPWDLHNDERWMGFAMCAVFAIPHISRDNLVPKFSCNFTLHLATNKGYLKLGVVFPLDMGGIPYQLIVFHLPRSMFPVKLIHCRHFFGTFECDRRDVKAKMSGIRLLYKQDFEEFFHTIECLLESRHKYRDVKDQGSWQSCVSEAESSTQNPLGGEITNVSASQRGIQSSPKPPSIVERIVEQDCASQETLSNLVMDNIDLIDRLIAGDTRNNKQTTEAGGSFQGQRSVSGISLKDQGCKLQPQDFDASFLYNSCFPACEMLEWFSRHSNESSVMFELPPNLYDDSYWMGLALCASFSVDEDPAAILQNLDSETSCHLICHLETDIGGVEPLHVYTPTKEDVMLLHLRGFMWLSYIPRASLPGWLNQCSWIEASFASDRPSVTVRKCGLRLIYQHDDIEFKQTIRHCMTSLSNHRGLSHQLMVENEQKHDYETIPSRTGSSSEDTGPERLRGPIDHGLKGKDKRILE